MPAVSAGELETGAVEKDVRREVPDCCPGLNQITAVRLHPKGFDDQGTVVPSLRETDN